MSKVKFNGVIPPLITPFENNGKVNEACFRKVMRYVIGNGCSGVFIGGSQGEFFAQDFHDRIHALEIGIDESNKTYPVIGGTTAVTTDEAIRLSREAQRVGCSAISVATPYFITVNEEELYAYYAAIAKSVDIPVLLYNNPDRTHNFISVSVAKRLMDIDNIIGMKDSSGDLTYANAIIDHAKDDFMLFCGKDTVIFNMLIAGAAGAVPATGNVAPKLIVELYNNVRSKDFDSARRTQKKLATLRNAFNLGSFPVVMKEALIMMGFDVGFPKPPIQPLSEHNRKILRNVLVNLDLLN